MSGTGWGNMFALYSEPQLALAALFTINTQNNMRCFDLEPSANNMRCIDLGPSAWAHCPQPSDDCWCVKSCHDTWVPWPQLHALPRFFGGRPLGVQNSQSDVVEVDTTIAAGTSGPP